MIKSIVPATKLYLHKKSIIINHDAIFFAVIHRQTCEQSFWGQHADDSGKINLFHSLLAYLKMMRCESHLLCVCV